MTSLQASIKQNYFQGYSYSYPHKSAYRPLEKPRSLKEIWQYENKDHLFLYIHVPFCEMRCGFCNLFTMANPKAPMQSPFLQALTRQAQQVSKALGRSHFARLAIGGGTPTFLSLQELEQLFDITEQIMDAQPQQIPVSVEASPKTITPEKLALLHQRGCTRISIGVQSFLLEETKALGRPQKNATVHQALQDIRDSSVPEMNIDLIYGIQGQTVDSWQTSLQQTLLYQPEEIFLYPLYVRPLTGLGLRPQAWNDHRLKLYRLGRDFLLQNGYTQQTMRIFRRANAPHLQAPPYDSPEDGMVGLGVGARSYAHNFHYSSDYAVGRKGVKQIIHDYIHQTDNYFSQAHYGVSLSKEEQKRRYLIKSLLEGTQLNFDAYQQFFGTAALDDFPQLQQLYTMQLTPEDPTQLQLNQAGLELSDVIGPWLYSKNVKEKMKKFEWV